MVNLEWYRTFVAIYQTGNMTRAAEELFISQPNVSIQLSNLESYVGYQLFVRKPRKMIPTELGKLLYTQVINSIESLTKVEGSFRKSALKHVKNLRIGTPLEYGVTELLEPLKTIDTNLSFTFDMVNELVALLKADKLDVVIATKHIPTDEVIYEPFLMEKFSLVTSSSTDTTLLEEVLTTNNVDEIERQLENLTWISYDHNLSIIRRFWKVNFNKRPQIAPKVVLPDMLGIRHAVSLGYGYAILSSLFLEQNMNGLKVVWTGMSETNNQLYLAYKKDVELEDQLQVLKDALYTE